MTRVRMLLLVASLATVAPQGSAQPAAPALDPRAFRMVDLTHPFDERTPYWPTSPTGFRLEQLSAGRTPGGWYYSANTFSAPEHGGTHLDAPIHFAEGRATVDRVPLERLVAPAVVIDVSARAAADADYRLTVACPSAKWIGASRCVPPCSGALNVFAE